MARLIVVGGGLLGMLTARELATGGNQITLIEKGEMAGESSWAGGGILSPLYPWRYPDSITQLASWSQNNYLELCKELKTSSTVDPEYSPTGMLIVAPMETETALAWAERHSTRMDIQHREKIRELEPNLASPPNSALWMPDIANVRNPYLTRALITDIKERGVRIRTQQTVTGVYQLENKVTGIETSDGILESDAVIICAGAWTGHLLAQITSPPVIHPVKGQMLLFKSEPGVIQRMVLEDNRYIIPRKDGRILFGSTIEENGFDKHTTKEAHDELYGLATTRFPILKKYPLEKHWAGLRPGSPAGVPYITEHPELSGLFINAGHFRNGVVLAPASARLCADLVMGREPILPPEPFSLLAARE